MISIIIPVYNTPKELAKCLKSLERQIFKEFEVLVVDDGSQPEIDINYQGPLNIQFFRVGHAGAPKARNFGFSKSKGGFVLFCDADMRLRQACLEKMRQKLKDNMDKSYVYSDFKYGWKVFRFWDFDKDKLKQTNYINTCSLLRREDFVGFDESLKKFQDWDLWLSLLEQGKTGVHIPEVLFKASVKRGKMSHWLPKIVYKLSIFKNLARVKEYESAKQIILSKHK